MSRANHFAAGLLATGILTASGSLALYFYTLPGLRRLPKAGRTSLDGVTTIADAVAACRQTGLTGWELVAYAQNLAARKFTVTNRPGITHFQILSDVRPLSPWIRPFAHLGSVVENVRRDRQALAQAYEEIFFEST